MAQKYTKNTYCVYLRVSTAKQGKSGLGIEAQRETVTRFIRERGGKIIAEFTEIESGKDNKRPKLAEAIKRCRLTGAKLVVAKLDRLSRNAAFLMALRDAGADFVAADLPDANTMTVGVMATVAQYEAEAISARTKAALDAARKRNKVLGGLRPNAPDISKWHKQGVAAIKYKAQERADDLREDIEPLVSEGLSMNAIAAHLNEKSIRTARGCEWTAMAVKRTLAKLEIQPACATARVPV